LAQALCLLKWSWSDARALRPSQGSLCMSPIFNMIFGDNCCMNGIPEHRHEEPIPTRPVLGSSNEKAGFHKAAPEYDSFEGGVDRKSTSDRHAPRGQDRQPEEESEPIRSSGECFEDELVQGDTFVAKLFPNHDTKFGIGVKKVPKRGCLQVVICLDEGAVFQWNKDNPYRKLQKGDLIISVNGKTDMRQMIDEVMKVQDFTLEVERSSC